MVASDSESLESGNGESESASSLLLKYISTGWSSLEGASFGGGLVDPEVTGHDEERGREGRDEFLWPQRPGLVRTT